MPGKRQISAQEIYYAKLTRERKLRKSGYLVPSSQKHIMQIGKDISIVFKTDFSFDAQKYIKKEEGKYKMYSG